MIDEKVGQQHQNHTSKKMSMILMLLLELLAGVCAPSLFSASLFWLTDLSLGARFPSWFKLLVSATLLSFLRVVLHVADERRPQAEHTILHRRPE